MKPFSMSCKAMHLHEAIVLAKTIEMGNDMLRLGYMDMDMYCRFVDAMNDAGKLLGIKFKWGNVTYETEIL